MPNSQSPTARNLELNVRAGGPKAVWVGVCGLKGDEFCFVRIHSQAISHEPLDYSEEAVSTFVHSGTMTRARGENRTIVHIGGEGSIMPGLGKSE